MTVPSKLAFALVALAVVGGGAALWARYGSLVYFDTLAAAFMGCFV